MFLTSYRFRWLRRAAMALALLAIPIGLVAAFAGRELPYDLKYVSGPEPETIDPALATAVLEVRLLSALFEGLLRMDPATLEPVPAACERFEVEPGFRRYRFVLREGLRWSDGSPLGAEDFVASWRRAADPATRAPLRREAARVAPYAKVVAERTIEIDLEAPLPELPALLTLPVFLPVKASVVAAAGERWTRPGTMVSNGPFRLARWRVGRDLVLERNEHYHREVGLERIQALTTSSTSVGGDTEFLLYETGSVDLIFSAPTGAHKELVQRSDVSIGPALTTMFLRFNTTHPVLSEVKVRRALTQSIDRASIVTHVLRGGERTTTSLVPPGLFGYEPAPGLAFDPGAASQAMDEFVAARSSKGPIELSFLYSASDITAGHTAEVLQAAWRELGVTLTLRPMERKAYFGAMRALDYDICWGNWVADYPDPQNFLDIFLAGSGSNRTGFEDPGYDRLLAEAARAASPEERAATLRRAEARLLQAAPLAPLYNPMRATMARPSVRGLSPNVLNLVDWAVLTRDEGNP